MTQTNPPLRPHPGPRRIDQLLIGLIGIGVILAAFAMVLAALFIGDEQHATAEAQTAQLESGVVAVIDGVAVTELDWQLALFSVRSAYDELAEVELEDYPETFHEYIAQHRTVLETYPPETAAFGSLLVSHATVAAAYEDGFEVDQAAIDAFVEEQREVTRRLRAGDLPVEPADLEQLEATIAVAGEDRFWSDVMPQWGLFAQASEHLFAMRGGNSAPDWREQWDDYQQDLAREADVTLATSLASSISLPQVLAYLEDVAAIEPVS